MNTSTQLQFLYLFERVGEPLYFGPKGTGATATYFNVPLDDLSEKNRDAAIEVQKRLAGVSSTTVNINKPARVPNFGQLSRSCPKNSIFSYFIPAHQNALKTLKAFLASQPNRDDFLTMCSMSRDSPNVNPTLWVYAVAGAIVQRQDMRGFHMPPLYEVIPDMFIPATTIRQAQQMARLPERDREIIQIDLNGFTGHSKNDENKLAYWREDLGINSHHWHWHIVFPLDSPRTGANSRDQKGQLFYYMHHSMLARYEAERLSNGLPLTRMLDLDEPLSEGYFSKLTSANSGLAWGTRQEDTKLEDVERQDDPDNAFFSIKKEEVKKFRDRIITAIDTGVYLNEQNQLVPLNWQTGTDLLGDMIEASEITPNRNYYSEFGLHNWGHILVAFAHDPHFKHRELIGVMGDSATAMRDPVFYRWHKYIDYLFDLWKKNQRINPPYQLNDGQLPLVWRGIEITGLNVQSAERAPNLLVTEWMQSDIDLGRGMDFMRTSDNQGPIWVRVTHLNHEPFQYTINVRNSGGRPVNGTFRVFMAPRFNEQGQRYTLSQQRLLFFEMDRFVRPLNAGDNQIVRRSIDSSVTIPWQESFRLIEQRAPAMPTANEAICGCGWPNHMLLPKGTSEGLVFDLFVIITNNSDDMLPGANNTPNRACRESLSFCGVLNEKFPDTKPMGYPFDREIRPAVGNTSTNNLMTTRVDFIENFMPSNSNGVSRQIRIVHINQTRVRPGGAPSTMEVTNTTPGSSTQTQTQMMMMSNPTMTNTGTNTNTNTGGNRKPTAMKPTTVPNRKPTTQGQQRPSGGITYPGQNGGHNWGGRPGGYGGGGHRYNGRNGRSPSPNSDDWENIAVDESPNGHENEHGNYEESGMDHDWDF